MVFREMNCCFYGTTQKRLVFETAILLVVEIINNTSPTYNT